MMIPHEFLNLFSAFGLAAAAGFNAWATLFIVALAARLNLLVLSPPYDVMGTDGVVIGLLILVIVEGLADKVPVFDHASHLIHTVLQPAAGAILFAAQGGVITDVSPLLAFFVGALVAGTIHTVRAAFRPIVTGVTGGVGNPIVSAAEDMAAVTITVGALLSPFVVGLIVICVVVLLLWLRQGHTHPHKAR